MSDSEHPFDEPQPPLTLPQAERWHREVPRTVTNVMDELLHLAVAHGQAQSRIAVLEAENHDLRVLLTTGPEGPGREHLKKIMTHSDELYRAARDLLDNRA